MRLWENPVVEGLTVCNHEGMADYKNYSDEILKAVEFIEANLERTIGVQDVCGNSHLSAWQFQRIFRAHVGDSIGNYLRGRRLAVSLKILQESPETRLLDIALRFQFNSHEAFTRAFAAYFGIAPSEIKKNPLRRLPMNKPRLDESKLSHIAKGIQKAPEIVTLPEKKFVGLAVEINSPLGIDTEFDGKIVDHWNRFGSLRDGISHRIPAVSFGLALSSGSGMEEERLTYLAAAEVTKFENVPPEFQTMTLESQTYAKFEIRGFTNSCHVTTDFIYGIWLPDSGYERAPGVDFEIFDHQLYRVNDEKSISHYLLPVRPV